MPRLPCRRDSSPRPVRSDDHALRSAAEAATRRLMQVERTMLLDLLRRARAPHALCQLHQETPASCLRRTPARRRSSSPSPAACVHSQVVTLSPTTSSTTTGTLVECQLAHRSTACQVGPRPHRSRASPEQSPRFPSTSPTNVCRRARVHQHRQHQPTADLRRAGVHEHAHDQLHDAGSNPSINGRWAKIIVVHVDPGCAPSHRPRRPGHDRRADLISMASAERGGSGNSHPPPHPTTFRERGAFLFRHATGEFDSFLAKQERGWNPTRPPLLAVACPLQ